MKKKILSLIAILALVLGLSGLFVACGEEKIEYRVTVLTVDDEPISDVTVSWMSGSSEKGKATTDADGVASCELEKGVYTIALSGSKALRYVYDEPATVNAASPETELALEVKRVNYTVTVTDKSNQPAQGVTVSWVGTNGTGGSGSGTTNANGVASCELDYGDYTVTLGNLPEDNFSDGGKTVSGANPSATFNLRAPNAPVKDYSVTVKSEGGLLFKNYIVMVYRNGSSIASASGETNDEGVFTFRAEADNYTVYSYETPLGYTAKPISLTADTLTDELELKSEIITDKPDSDTRYVMGDIFHNYTFEAPYELTQYEYEREEDGTVKRDEDGNAIIKKDESDNEVIAFSGKWSKTVAEILEEKQVLILNNWGTNCSWCVKEMPFMQEVYEQYGDQIEIVAVSNYYPYDSVATIENYAKNNGLTFPLMRDTNDIATKFGVSNWPTTIVIDRYGAVARIEVGAVTSVDAWERMILMYIGDYVQSFTPGDKSSDSVNHLISMPDIELSENHYETLTEAVNNKNIPDDGYTNVVWSTGTTEYEYAWPFLVSGDEVSTENGTLPDGMCDKPYIYSSNAEKYNSMAVICAEVTMKAGAVLTFDYYIESEAGYDTFFIIWDGRILREISGTSGGWTTCSVFADIADGTHTLILTYRKDDSTDEGRDTVYIRDLRFTQIGDINTSTDMLRLAGYGGVGDNGHYNSYVSVAADQNDKNGFGSAYYHVNLEALGTTLGNPALVGNDKSPLLFVNLTGATPWSSYSLSELATARVDDTEDAAYTYSFDYTIDGVTRNYRSDFLRYLSAAGASYVPNCVPVDEFLQKLLVEFMKEVYKVENERIDAENAKIDADTSKTPEEKEKAKKKNLVWTDKTWLEVCYFYSHYGTEDEKDFIGNPIVGVMEETAIEINWNADTTTGTYETNLTRNMAPFAKELFAFTPAENAVYKFESKLTDATQSAQIWIYHASGSVNQPLVEDGDLRVHRDGTNEQNFVVYYYMQAGEKYYICTAFLMADAGTYSFTITKEDEVVRELVPCSDDLYVMILDQNGNWNGKIELSGAVEYEIKDGYYYAKNGEMIYVDVEHVFTSLTPLSLSELLTKDVQYPSLDTPPADFVSYRMFDFTRCVVWWEENDAMYFETHYNISAIDRDVYKDYTEIFTDIINTEKAKQGESYDGLIPVTQEIVDILTLFFQLRVNNSRISEAGSSTVIFEKPDDNEWLRFCWYTKIHSAEFESLPVESND